MCATVAVFMYDIRILMTLVCVYVRARTVCSRLQGQCDQRSDNDSATAAQAAAEHLTTPPVVLSSMVRARRDAPKLGCIAARQRARARWRSQSGQSAGATLRQLDRPNGQA